MKQKPNVDITILVPTKNEEITISRFIEWCFVGFENANLRGEIVLMDSSTDQTPIIAHQKGVKVIPVSERGLGIAYYKGREFVNGRYVILGDADCTYDFKNLQPFLDKLREGYELVVGNRFRGNIEKNAMPFHHQYFGSPVTSFIFKHSLGIPTGDIHCGMRALTADLYRKLPFTELGWEYASEMIVSARNLGARICEVPINFLKEPHGRISHHVRSGWLTPYKAGWGTLRVTASFSLDRLLMLPGTLLAAIGLALNFLLLTLGPEILKDLGLGNLSSSIFTTFSLVGFLLGGLGLIAHLIYYPTGKAIEFLAGSRMVNTCFAAVISGGLIALTSSIILFDKWKQGFFSNISSFDSDNLTFVGVFNISITLFIGLAVLLLCSFIASYMSKLRKSVNRNFN